MPSPVYPVTIIPTSSMCASTSTVMRSSPPVPRFVANRLPIVSVAISSTCGSMSSRILRRTSCSAPLTPMASESCLRISMRASVFLYYGRWPVTPSQPFLLQGGEKCTRRAGGVLSFVSLAPREQHPEHKLNRKLGGPQHTLGEQQGHAKRHAGQTPAVRFVRSIAPTLHQARACPASYRQGWR